jgi:endonuclease/exonuclease/phosphatase family metal-dependent hydrolase
MIPSRLIRARAALLLLAMLASLVVSEAFAMQSERRPARDVRSSQRQQAPTNKFGLAQAPKRAPGAVRIAAYNVLNLFDHVDDPALTGVHDDMLLAAADDRCRALADAIRKTDADIIGLEEVESLECVKWFRDTYLKDAGYTYICSFDVGYYRGVEQAVLSRIEITGSHVWPNAPLANVKRDGPGFTPVPPSNEPPTFQRSPLLVEFRTESGYELCALVVHHKAGRDFDHHREAEALRIVEIIHEITKADPSRNLVVMGDFNAAPWDKSLRVYLEAGMIDTMAHRTTQGDDEALLYKTHESNRVLDYILINSAAHREFVIGSSFVLGTMFPPASYDWRTDPHPPGYASDHYPIAIELMPEDRM